jgi:phospholipid/cholesterol/gamma-HCH transport system substrate-binding protein
VSTSQRWSAVKLVVFLAGCFLISSYFFGLAGTHILPSEKPYSVQAVVPTAVSLAKAGDVREAGVNVGRVKKIADRGNATIMQLDLEKKYAPVYNDATVLLRAKSVAGENYVEIDPGTPKAGALPSGGVLSVKHAEEATQIDQLFSVFNQARRRDLQRALGGLSEGLSDGGGDLNKTLEGASAVANEGKDAVGVLGENSKQVGGLVDSFGRVTRALGERRAALQTFTRQVKVAAEAAGSRDRQLRELIATLPGFLRQTRETSNHLQSFSGVATPVVRDLRLASDDLVPTVRDLLPAARAGRGLARDLRTFARKTTPAIARLKPFAASGTTFVSPLEGFLRQGNPFFAYMAPYYREISTFFALDAASFQTTDALGHVARVTLPVSRSNAPGVFTPEEEHLLQELSGSMDTRGTNAYPAPGGSSAGKPPSGSYPRLEAEPPYTTGDNQ